MHSAFQTCGAYYFVKTHFAQWIPISQTPKVLKKLKCSGDSYYENFNKRTESDDDTIGGGYFNHSCLLNIFLSASSEEKKVLDAIKKQIHEGKKQQEYVKNLVDRIAAEIERTNCTGKKKTECPTGNHECTLLTA